MDRTLITQYYEIKHMDLTKSLEIFYIPFLACLLGIA